MLKHVSLFTFYHKTLGTVAAVAVLPTTNFHAAILHFSLEIYDLFLKFLGDY